MAAPRGPALTAPAEVLGQRYKILSPLGAGGMGAVFVALDAWREGCQVALKRAPLGDASVRQSLEHEFEWLCRLRHPNVIAARDFGSCASAGAVFYTMDLADGVPLPAAAAPLSLHDRAELLAQLCRALAYVHGRGVVHADVKGENVIVREERAQGRARRVATLVDFGLSVPVGSPRRATGGFSGTLTHAAPELGRGDDPADPRIDLYALGATAFQVLAGRLPFEHADPLALLQAHRQEAPPPLRSVAPAVPAPVAAVVDRLLAKDPALRPASALALGAAISAAWPDIPLETLDSSLAHARATSLVGVDPVRGALEALLQRAADPREGGTRTALLVGAAGTGKTRLLSELRDLAKLRRIGTLWGSAAGGRARGEPYAVLVEPLRDALHVLGLGSEVVRERLPELVKIDPALTRLTGVAPSVALPMDDERLRLARAVWDVLQAVATRPALVVLDDVHELGDEAAWVVGYLVRNVALSAARGRPVRLGVVAAARPGGPPLPVGQAGPLALESLDVPSLDPAGTRALLASMFVGLERLDEIASRIHAGVGGVAGLAEQWCAALVRSGALWREPDGWRADLRHAAFARPPTGMVEAIADSLASLDAEAVDLLRLLALLPQELHVRDLAALTSSMPADLGRPLETLQRSELVRVVPRPDGRFAAIASAVVREAVLRGDDPEDRSRRAGSWLDRVRELGLLDAASRAAMAQQAGRPAEAAAEWRRALDEAAGRRDAARAEAHAERLAAVTSGSERRRALRGRAEWLLELDRVDQAESCVTAAAPPAAEAEDTERMEHARIEALVLQRRGRFAHALERIELVLSLAPAGHAERTTAARLRGALMSQLGMPAADDVLGDLVSAAPTPEERRRALLVVGAHHLRRQRHAEAIRVLDELARDAGGDAVLEASCANNQGVAALRQHDLKGAARHFARAVSLRERAVLRSAMAGTLTNLALVELERGRPSHAVKHLHAALEIKEETGDHHGQGLCHANIAVVGMVRHDVVSARRHALVALELLARVESPMIASTCELTLAGCDLLVGRHAEAAARSQDAWSLAERAGLPRQALAARLLACEAALRQRRRPTPGVLRELEVLAGRSEGGEHETERLEALVLLAQGLVGTLEPWPDDDAAPPDATDWSRALEHAREAQRIAEAQLNPHLRLLARTAVASILLADPAQAEASLAEAASELAAARAEVGGASGRGWRVALASAEGLLAWRRGDVERAEAGLEDALRQVRHWLSLVPRAEREAFLADERRACLRAALVRVRGEKLRRSAAGRFFDVLERPRPDAAEEGASPAELARQLARAKQEASRLREVISVTRNLNALEPVRELLDRILEGVLKFMNAERAVIVLAEGGRLDVAATRDRRGRPVERGELAISRSVLAEVVRTQVPVLTSDARTDARFHSKESVLQLDLRSVLVAPMVGDRRVLGAIYIDNPHATGVFTERDLDLLALFAAQAAVAVENARLHATRLQKDLLDQELAIARNIQIGLLPRNLPSTPYYRVAAAMEPARDIGGDYYDVIDMPGGSCRLAIGDVSGKGVPAGLFMVMARTILRSVATPRVPLVEAVALANDALAAQIEDDKFMTLLVLEPTPDGRAVRTCSAGHEPPVLFRRSTGRAEVLPGGGLALGIFPGIRDRLEERSVETHPGDLLVCYSDGVTECRAPDGSMFGRDRLVRVVQAAARQGADGALAEIRREVEAFRAGAERSDDVTLLLLETR
jgi:sigma-B regulation protein RsbU (phosphoserine phosphatase)